MSKPRIPDVQKWLEQSRGEFTEDYTRDRIDREEAEADNDFANSTDESKSQWREKAYKDREAAGVPILQFNRIPTYLQHIANAGRQNKPALKITAGDRGTPETAQMLESKLRQIEYDSDASTVFDTARDQQVSSGRAFIRILTQEIDSSTGEGGVEAAIESAFVEKVIGRLSGVPQFASSLAAVMYSLVRKFTPKANGKKQVARIERINNQFSVIWGPHRKYDASDADRCWVITSISKDEHKRKYGKDSLLNQSDFAPFEGSQHWLNVGERGEMVQIAEKFVKEYDEAGEVTGVCRYVINGREILDPKPADLNDPKAGKFIVNDIPIVPQWGREVMVNRVMRHMSLHNPGKDWQRLINLYGSTIAQLIGGAPKDRFNAPVGSIAQHHEEAYAGNSPTAIRYYIQYAEDGRMYNKPEIDTKEPAIQAASEGLQQAIEGLKSSMGIFDASLGARSNEVTGIAQERRQKQSEVTNYHFPSNEERTRKRVGQILLKMISVLETPGTKTTIRHYDGKTEVVPIGVPYEDPRTKKTITHVLTDMDYGVEVESGPSYANAMEQKLEAEQALITAVPELMLTEVGVNMLRNSGRPGADQDADALERYINLKTPGLIPDKDSEAPIPPKIAAQIQQLQQKLQTTDAFAQSLHQEIATKKVEQEGKLAIQQASDSVKLEITKMQEETKRVIALAKIKSDEALAKLEAELGIVHKRTEMGHEAEMQDKTQEHTMSMQGAEHAHADASQETELAASAASQGAQQEHEAGQAEAARESEPVGADK